MSNSITDDLEMKIAFLEDALEKLSDEFFAQQKQISVLQDQQTKLTYQVQTLNEVNTTNEAFVEEKPPHY